MSNRLLAGSGCTRDSNLLGEFRWREESSRPRADGLEELDAAFLVALVASLLAGDWGLWRTSRQTIQTSRDRLAGSGLPPADRRLIDDRLQAIWARVEAHPKSLAWRLRGRVGDRIKWYQEP